MTPELILAAAFTAGFFGSTHCLGMCGAIVILFEGQSASAFDGLPRRMVYNLGRLFFYTLLGIVAGASGALLTAGVDTGLDFLRALAALLIIALGLNLAVDWRALWFLERAGSLLWARISPLARHVLPISSPGRALAAGFLWGALPCGLVYSALALAAASGSATGGGLVMLAFWLGTVPALLVAGLSANRLNEWRNRTGLRRIAGALMIAVGLVALSMSVLHRVNSGHQQHRVVSPATTMLPESG